MEGTEFFFRGESGGEPGDETVWFQDASCAFQIDPVFPAAHGIHARIRGGKADAPAEKQPFHPAPIPPGGGSRE